MEGKVQKVQKVQGKKNDSANFYIGGMACREKDERRKGGIQSRGTTKKEEPEKEQTEKEEPEKEEPEKEKTACSDC